MAHVGQESGFRTARLFRGSERCAQGLPISGQLLSLPVLPLHRLFKLPAVLLLLILDDKRMQHAGSQHISHGVEGHQGIKNLNRDEQRHGDAEHPDCKMAEPYGAF